MINLPLRLNSAVTLSLRLTGGDMVADGDDPGEDPEYDPVPVRLVTVRIMFDVAPGSLECDNIVSVLCVVDEE